MGRQNYWQSENAMNAPSTATTQAEIDEYTRRNVPFLIVGGTKDDPLYVRRATEVPPGIGGGSYVTVLPENVSQPASVCVIGRGARVLGLRNARIVCIGESVVTACDQSKVRMYEGMVTAKDFARVDMYNRARGRFYGKSKAFCRNRATAFCYDESTVYLCHQARACLCDASAHLWIRDFLGGSIEKTLRTPTIRP